MSSSAPEKKIILLSSDGEVFDVEEALAAESQAIKQMIENDSNDNVIPLVTGKILSQVIEYCKRHVDDKLASSEDDIKAFDTDFDLNLAAYSLNIKSLLYLTCQALTPLDPIKKSPFGGLVEAWLPDSLDLFRDKVPQFLLRCAKLMDYDLEGMPIWLTLLEHKKREACLPLYIIEENVKSSAKPFCNYCSPAGQDGVVIFWQKMNYHFIIPASDEWNNPLDEGTFDLETHLLHGLIHSDGYGHLVCINGIEGGSEFIPGREIMDFWDFICTSLHARQISVCDLSRKNGMDLRLIYGVSYGGSWFGRWGYRFCRGTFGSTEEDYRTAIDTFSSLKLDRVIEVFNPKKEGEIINQIIHCYRGMSDDELVTVRDLFGFMVTLKSKRKHPTDSRIKEVRYKKYSDIVKYMYSRWTISKLENTGSMIGRCLVEKRSRNEGSNGRMTRQEIWDKLSVHFDHGELLSDVLKLMNNVVVEVVEFKDMNAVERKYIVRRGLNGVTKMQEYSIHDFKEDCLSAKPVGQSVDHDIRYLYEKVLCGYPSDSVGNSIKIILQSKHFAKEFSLGDSNRFSCQVTSWDHGFSEIPVGEFRGATIGYLKIVVQNAMRDTYFVAENVKVLGMEEVLDESVWLNCYCCGLDVESKLKFQGENKKVICDCGARDDDGEIMVQCYECYGWRHVHCSGYKPIIKMNLIECCPPPFKRFEYVY